MATQIYAVPDDNGVIHVACGEDILEIVVGPRTAGAGGGGTGTDDPYIALTSEPGGGQGKDWSLIDKPYVFAVPGATAKKPLSLIDVDFILKKITTNAPTGPSRPSGVMLNLDAAVDLHEISRLHSRLDEASPGIGLAVNFGKRGG